MGTERICPATSKKCIVGCFDRNVDCFVNTEAELYAKKISGQIKGAAIESINKDEVIESGTDRRLQIADLIVKQIKKIVAK